MLLSFAACNENPGETTTTPPANTQPSQQGSKVTYTITVETAGGMPMAGLDLYIYTDDSLEDLESFGKTDENGVAQITARNSTSNVVVISGAPKGYDVKKSYPVLSGGTKIVLESAPIQGANFADVPTNKPLGLGDVVYDFTVTDSDGKDITLSQLLEEKDMVMLNFWYTTCEWCLKEFPYMQEAYQMYQEDVAIIALNPYEDLAKVKGFKESNGLTFNMASCPMSWAQAFNVGVSGTGYGFPTSVVIDRYGVICLVEVGGLTSITPFRNTFEHFTGDDYKQQLCPGGIADITVTVKPTYEMPSHEEMNAALSQGDISVTYKPEEGEDGEYSWPFILGEKDGETVAYASNIGVDNSYAILYANVQLKAGQALGFDYLSSCASGSDILYVIVNGDDIYQISGLSEPGDWKSCFPWVATEDGEYEVALCYLKDDGDAAGDDTVYVRNFRTVDAADIDAPSYIPREAATTKDGFEFSYVDIVLNPKDGYYHVGSENGPLLLATLNTLSQFSEEETLLQMISEGGSCNQYYDAVIDYCSYASNSSLPGVCTVNEELAEYLKKIAAIAGFTGDANEWLKFCRYFDAYGTDGQQLVDPIAGLAPFSAFTATEGVGVESNYIYYDRTIIPRGLFAKFVPTRSGVYRITSNHPANSTVEGWIFDESWLQDKDADALVIYEMDERLLGMQYPDGFNDVSMVLYMEAGKEYYIDICFWDLYETGYIYYDIEYVAKELDHFRLASPGYFTYDADATGDNPYYTIAGGVKPILVDGKYYVDLGDGKVGSLLYADFSGTTLFNMPLVDMIERGGFDFSKTENDETVLMYLAQNDNDPDKTKAYLKELWGEDYEENAANYQVDDVLAGRFHGKGEDYTEIMRSYAAKMATGPIERQGCVEMTEELAAVLQILMDKYTFAGVDHSWTKLCYYYDHLGPEAE